MFCGVREVSVEGAAVEVLFLGEGEGGLEEASGVGGDRNVGVWGGWEAG